MLKNTGHIAPVNPPAVGAWSGLAMVVLWTPMILVIPMFPDLDARTEVVVFWRDHGSMTLQIMALVVAGYPFLLLFLANVAARSARGQDDPVLSWAALAAGVMFMTGLCTALGLAAAAGKIVKGLIAEEGVCGVGSRRCRVVRG